MTDINYSIVSSSKIMLIVYLTSRRLFVELLTLLMCSPILLNEPEQIATGTLS